MALLQGVIWVLVEASLVSPMQAEQARFSWGIWKGGAVSCLSRAVWGGAHLQKLFEFLSPIDWLRLDLFFFSGHWKIPNLVEKAIKIIIQCKYEIAQHYWLSLCFTLNNKRPISCFHLLP